ncbi:MAG: hypothetical protein UR81_C0002G0007 [Candidatus Levybacteria bacterium GW2011_GWB1_35_5]|nr:MAG: hypothetical protein UR81_C0002G0007 [Candidatus Levybacteria bacterium GW2011_GWB1_35_5]
MSIERGHQLVLSDFSSEWPRPAEQVVDATCRSFYERATGLVRKYNIIIPNRDLTFGRKAQIVRPQDHVAQPVYDVKHKPRICDVEVPDDLKKLVDTLSKKTKYKDKLFLPDTLELYMILYGRWTSNSKLALEERYDEWFRHVWGQWWNGKDRGLNFLGWSADIDNENGKRTSFMFSSQGALEQMRTSDKPRFIRAIKHDHIIWGTRQTANFKDGSLVSLLHEVPNGTFFQDPKGPREEIYPWWVKDVDSKRKKKKKEELASKEDWDRYMEKIRRHEAVISGRTSKRVLQGPGVAKDNLERWRDLIYYACPQLFDFRLVPFRAEIGYRREGRFGEYVSRNPNSYRKLSSEEANQRLQELMPAA